MIEVKSTKGIEKNMRSEIENLVRKAYEEGKADAEKVARAMDKCSWEQGVKDAWETIIDVFTLLGNDGVLKANDRVVIRAMADILKTYDYIDATRRYVDAKNLEEDKEEYVPKEGDVVLDPIGNECIITNIESHIHVIYIKNRKTHKWELDTEFKPTGKHVVGIGKIEL